MVDESLRGVAMATFPNGCSGRWLPGQSLVPYIPGTVRFGDYSKSFSTTPLASVSLESKSLDTITLIPLYEGDPIPPIMLYEFELVTAGGSTVRRINMGFFAKFGASAFLWNMGLL